MHFQSYPLLVSISVLAEAHYSLSSSFSSSIANHLETFGLISNDSRWQKNGNRKGLQIMKVAF